MSSKIHIFSLNHGLHATDLKILKKYNFLTSELGRSRSSQEVIYKESMLKNLVKFTRKHLYWSLFFNNVTGLRAQV